MEIVPPPGAQPLDPTNIGTAPGGGIVQPITGTALGTPRDPGPRDISIPVVEAVEAVTLSPFVRGALVGGLAGAAVVGALWWFGGRK